MLVLVMTEGRGWCSPPGGLLGASADAGASWRPPSSCRVEIVTQEGRGKLVSFWPFPNFPAPPGAGDVMWPAEEARAGLGGARRAQHPLAAGKGGAAADTGGDTTLARRFRTA